MCDANQANDPLFVCGGPDEVVGVRNRIEKLLDGEAKQSFILIYNYFLSNEGFNPTAVFEKLNNLRVSEINSQFSWIHDTAFAARERAKKNWGRIRHAAHTSPVEVVRQLTCPLCGGSLRIQFDPDSKQPSGETAGCLKIECSNCVAGTYLDGLDESPSWFGPTQQLIETRPPHST